MPEPCRGGIRFGNRVFRCWKKEGHGSLDLTGAMAAELRRVFLPAGPAARARRDPRGRRADGLQGQERDRSGERAQSDLARHRRPTSTGCTARGLEPARHHLNFSIGQGENTQTLINMIRFYQGLAGDGVTVTPYIVRPSSNRRRGRWGSPAEELDGLRHALIAVVERGTAAGQPAGGLAVAGKTGTAQNPHGEDHGWFIGFAPADKPELIVGGIMEFAEHGTTVAPYVVQMLRRYFLGPTPSARSSSAS